MKNLTVIFFLLLAGLLFAKPHGSIWGVVTDLETGEPLIGASVFVDLGAIGAATNENGEYLITNIPVGKITLTARYIGYQEITYPDIEIFADSTVIFDIDMKPEAYESEMVQVIATKPIVRKSVSNSTSFITNGNSYKFSNNEANVNHNTEEYASLVENGFLTAMKTPLSTFAADIDGASYSNARRFIINQHMLPHKGAVRVEEFINYFDYSYKEPTDDKPLAVNVEYGDCPWNEDNRLVHIGLQSKKIMKEKTLPSNLVFLIDVSGSMDSPERLPLLKKAFKMLVQNLDAKDKVAIVVYASSTGLVLPSTSCENKEKIFEALAELEAGGSTAGGEGIKLAYKTVLENFIPEGNNRVILATDGDFNVGISSTSELVDYIKTQRDKGVFLSVLGFGMGNYKDERLQQIADKGNGSHAYIDNINEAKKVFVNELYATLYTVAKDVKIQVEFNPAYVESYRLIGYENRKLNDEDFEDDKKDAGEIGSGHTVTALYEVVPAKNYNIKNELKYQTATLNEDAKESGEVLTVKIRYKEPDGDVSREFSEVLRTSQYNKNLTDNFSFAAAVAQLGMLLADSEFKGNTCCDSILEMANASKGDDPFGYRSEFITLVERVKILKNL